jgi:hypothetical protein
VLSAEVTSEVSRVCGRTAVIIALVAFGLVVGLLSVLVVGLLRSHAEILDRLTQAEHAAEAAAAPSDPHRWRPPEERVTSVVAPSVVADTVRELSIDEVSGETLDRVPRVVRLTHEKPTLIAFLSTGCLSCASFFEAFAASGPDHLDPDVDLLIVPKGREEENLTKLRKLAPASFPFPTLMSSETWARLEVPGSPYFVLVDGETHHLLGAGSANTWQQVQSLVEDSLGEREAAAGGTSSRLEREHADLAGAGIGPDHPSLYAPMIAQDGSSS